jgi:PPK2 family polyphosphate:nucleotide phosphotransferase
LKRKAVLEPIQGLLKNYRITEGKHFKLEDIDPQDTGHMKSEYEDDAKHLLKRGVELLAELQDRLAAQGSWGVLVIFQAMDAAGKDGAIKHVMSGVNPQGVQVHSFKQPSSEELSHDFLWRCVRCLPERGRIGIFNRSYYEDVLVVRVHKDLLDLQKLPKQLVTSDIWEERLEDIRSFERHLVSNGILPLKFFLHLSKKEQTKRLLARLEQPEKNWKFSPADLKEREYWHSYMKAYEDAIKGTATKKAPWYVIPSDNKWFTRLCVAAAIVETLEHLDLEYPAVTGEMHEALLQAKKTLLKDDL